MLLQTVVFSGLLAVSWCGELDFPPGFKFGAATSAYQVEGAWNISGKSESFWDRLLHFNTILIIDGSDGDIACDSYHLWRRDVEIAKELGLHFYRFSICWPRLLPSGLPNQINDDGKMYYSNLIDELLRNGIEPVVTLYHFDLPQVFQDIGGWTNPLSSDWFADYARVAYSLYGDRVKTWITINEPMIICDLTYTVDLAPPVPHDEIACTMCIKNILLAHAKAWRTYDEEFRPKYHGQVSITHYMIWYEPASPEDEELAELAREYIIGRFSHPIFSKKDGWPPVIEKFIAEEREKGGPSKLPTYTKQEIDFIRGTYDFYGVNMYTSRKVRKARPGEQIGPWPGDGAADLNLVFEQNPDWKLSTHDMFRPYPEGIRRQLSWLKKTYGDIQFIIMENGGASRGGLEDDDRIQYFHDHLRQVLLAIKEDGVNVTGYTVWALMDTFEWILGYDLRLGLYEVDFTSPLRTRTPRHSARYYADVIKQHSLHVPEKYNKDELYCSHNHIWRVHKKNVNEHTLTNTENVRNMGFTDFGTKLFQ